MERLTKVISCPDGTKIYDISNKIFGLNTSRADKTRIILEKLAVYEDLEELIGIPLEELARIFHQHIPDGCQHPKKAIVLTDGDVDKWREYQQLEENDKNINIPNEAYFIKDGQIQSGWVQEAVYSICRKTLLDIRYDDNSLDSYRGYLGNEVFLTKSEAEARLKELRGNND